MTTSAPVLTWLYVPGDRPDRFAKAFASETDVVIVDLEDAVTPAHKEAARANVRALLREGTPKPANVRVNGLRSEWASADLAMLAEVPPFAGVRVPKVEGPEDVARVRGSLQGRDVPIQCLIETARGVEAAYAIATADPAVASIGLGEADLRSDLGIADDDGLLWSRSRVVVAARAAGLPPPVMSAYTNVADLDGLAAACRRARALGFLGGAAIHPRQLPVIAAAFTPTEAEIRAARELLDALARGDGVGVLPDGRFVDRAMLEGARRMIALSERGRDPR